MRVCRDPEERAQAKVSRAQAAAASKREQLAQAAEARMARLQLLSQQQQLWCSSLHAAAAACA